MTFRPRGPKVALTASASTVAPFAIFERASAPNRISFAKGFANKEGAGSFHYFKQELNDQVTRKVALANDLRKALKEETLEVYYQPKVSLLDDTLVGVEALCRWNHPVMGMISPTEFIQIAEEEGLIGDLGMWVLKTACNQLLEWKAELDCDFGVSVNVSPKQFLDEQAMQWALDFVAKSPISNRLVEFELTESTLLSNFETSLDILNRFIGIGCGLAIDDFGTGYSSLSYLGKLPAKTLKIDKSFVHLIESNNQYKAIVGGIIKLAHSLGLTVIAEGVETEAQREILAKERCDEIQGSLVALPLAPKDFIEWLNNWQTQRNYSSLCDEDNRLVS